MTTSTTSKRLGMYPNRAKNNHVRDTRLGMYSNRAKDGNTKKARRHLFLTLCLVDAASPHQRVGHAVQGVHHVLVGATLDRDPANSVAFRPLSRPRIRLTGKTKNKADRTIGNMSKNGTKLSLRVKNE